MKIEIVDPESTVEIHQLKFQLKTKMKLWIGIFRVFCDVVRRSDTTGHRRNSEERKKL